MKTGEQLFLGGGDSSIFEGSVTKKYAIHKVQTYMFCQLRFDPVAASDPKGGYWAPYMKQGLSTKTSVQQGLCKAWVRSLSDFRAKMS